MGKLELFKLFHKDPFIRRYLPSTVLCNLLTLKSYLLKYKTVFIKPVNGNKGRGVIKAWKENGKYAYVIERGNPIYCSNTAEMFQKLRLAKKTHVIQQGITLAKIHGRPFDVRLMMMRDRKKNWKYTGMLAKVAGRRSIITNVARGHGYAETVGTALSQSLGSDKNKIARIKNEIIRLGYRCNRVYDRHCYDWQIGYDIGIDHRGKIWLIEANPRDPSHILFDRLKNKSMYRRIQHMTFVYKHHVGKPPST
ncbi:MAG TPA: YheC/YheD family protein [Bacilli bacterium]